MDKLSSFLQKFTQILSSKESLVSVVKDVLLKEVGIDVDKENISVRGGHLTLNISPTIKTQIFMRKDSILQKINGAVGRKVIQDLH